MIYELGGFTYSRDTGMLSRGDEPVKIPAKTLDVLGVLVENHDRVVTRDELMSRVWPDLFVEEANVSVHISNLRKLFKNDLGGNVRIETYPKQGYRLSGVTIASEMPSQEQEFLTGPQPNETVRSNHLNLAVVGLCVLAVIILAASMFRPSTTLPIGTIRMARVPFTENTIALTISPDGQYMAHVFRQGNKRSLRLRDLRTNEERELVPPDAVALSSVRFSPNGNEVFFNRNNTIFAVHTAGGGERTAIEDAAGTITFSPNGNNIAFVRKQGQNSVLMVASADGSEQRQIAVRIAPDYFYASEIAWSPHGDRIAAGAGTARGERKTMILWIDPTSGETGSLSEAKFTGIDGLVWLADGSGLVLGGFETASAKTHVWFLPLPGGVPRRVTNDDNNYGGISATADGRTILAGQFRPDSSVWMDRNDEEPATPVTLEKHHEFQFISWAPEDRILFSSSSTPDRDVWVMNSSGGDVRQLTSKSRNNLMPVGSPDGRYVVFASNRAPSGAYNIWRMNNDGTDPKQITFGDGELQAVVSADSQWIFYTSGATETPPAERRIWKVPIEGGQPEQVVHLPSRWPDVSPDGKSLAFVVMQGDRAPWKVALLSLENGAMKVLDLWPNDPIRWTPDGKSISFVKTEEGQDVSNVWTFPVDGGEAKQITRFVTHFVINHDWSPDGRLFCSRSMTIRDAFLITDFR
jgi:eukaryotic-like serine/threonine-protein kinase